MTAREHAGIVGCAYLNIGWTSDDAPSFDRRLVRLLGLVMLDRRVASVVPGLAVKRAEVAVEIATAALVDERVIAGTAGNDVVPRAGIALAIGEQRGGKCLDAHVVLASEKTKPGDVLGVVVHRPPLVNDRESVFYERELLGFFCNFFAIAFSWQGVFLVIFVILW